MPGLITQPWEHPATTAGAVAEWTASTDGAALVRAREALRPAHDRAQAERRAMCAALLTATSAEPARWRQVQAIAIACRLAAELRNAARSSSCGSCAWPGCWPPKPVCRRATASLAALIAHTNAMVAVKSGC